MNPLISALLAALSVSITGIGTLRLTHQARRAVAEARGQWRAVRAEVIDVFVIPGWRRQVHVRVRWYPPGGHSLDFTIPVKAALPQRNEDPAAWKAATRAALGSELTIMVRSDAGPLAPPEQQWAAEPQQTTEQYWGVTLLRAAEGAALIALGIYALNVVTGALT